MKPARAGWELREGSQTNVNLQSPRLVATVFRGGVQGSDSRTGTVTGNAVASATFDWVPGVQQTPSDQVRVNHDLAVSDSVTTELNMGGTWGSAYARASITINGYEHWEQKWWSNQVEPSSSPSVSNIQQYANYHFTIGPNGVENRVITPTFSSSLATKAEASSSQWGVGGFINSMHGADAICDASSITTTGFSIED